MSAATLSVRAPVDSVTWRTSSGSPKNFPMTGVIPSMSPIDVLPPKPEMLRKKNRENQAIVPRPTILPKR